MSGLQENKERIEARILAACARAGRDPADIRLIWVSKNHPRERVQEALDLGARYFGENRVQEALEKFSPPFPPSPAFELHLIGRLQKNKVRKILPLASTLHSIDSLELLEAVDRIAGELGLRRDVLLQVNTSREPQKGGFEPDELPKVLENLKSRRTAAGLPPLPHLRLVGLMTMGPLEGGAEEARPCFRELKGMLEAIRRDGAFPDMAWLSMGMTGDFEVAVEEGAHFLRIGTGLFGHPAGPGQTGDIPAN